MSVSYQAMHGTHRAIQECHDGILTMHPCYNRHTCMGSRIVAQYCHDKGLEFRDCRDHACHIKLYTLVCSSTYRSTCQACIWAAMILALQTGSGLKAGDASNRLAFTAAQMASRTVFVCTPWEAWQGYRSPHGEKVGGRGRRWGSGE